VKAIMIRAVVRSLFVVCVLAGVGFAETPAPASAPTTAHVAKKHAHHKIKRKARKAKRRHHHKVKKHAAATQTK
jgi:uncharacterized membrane protein